MARKGRNFEIAYADLFDLNEIYYNISSPKYLIDKVTGEKREVDVFANYKDESNNERSIVIECRDRNQIQDVTWIEQLITKKNDLGIDLLIAITTNKFTKPAIDKAASYGVILEKGELINENTIENIRHQYFCDVHYLILELVELKFILNNNEVVNIKDLFTKNNIIDQKGIMDALKYGPFLEIDIHKILKDCDIKEEDFFNLDNNKNADFAWWSLIDANKAPTIINRFGITAIYFKLHIVPHKITLFLNQSMSTFTVGDSRKNKSYKAVFGNNEENITIGYMNNNKVTTKVNLKTRKYHRFVGGQSTINTIFPKDAIIDYTIDNIDDVALNDIDYSKVLL